MTSHPPCECGSCLFMRTLALKTLPFLGSGVVQVSISPLLNLPQDITGGKAEEIEDSKTPPSRFFKNSKLYVHMQEWRVVRYCSTETLNNQKCFFLFSQFLSRKPQPCPFSDTSMPANRSLNGSES